MEPESVSSANRADSRSDESSERELSWSSCTEAASVVFYRPHLTRTLSVALIVGSVLFVVNQLDVVLAGDATARTWTKVAVTYCVPFFVANFGVLTATRRSQRSG
jgi:hypothetical protein